MSGGIRFGPVNVAHVEAVFRSSEDASAVATLARWIPAFLQLKGPENFPGVLVETMENFTVYASGRRAVLSFRIPEDKVRALVEKWKHRPIE